jgi:hypothetical protein
VRSGDTLHSLLSPSSQGSGGAPSVGNGVLFPQLDRQMAGLSTGVSSGSEGGLGEFSIRALGGSGARDSSLFVLAPELLPQLCLGAVNGGVKFCTLPCDKCTVGAHTKKVAVQASNVYANAGWNAVYTYPSLPIAALETNNMSSILGELHPREEWLQIFPSTLTMKTKIQMLGATRCLRNANIGICLRE